MQRVIAKVNPYSDTLKSKRTEEAYAYQIKEFLATPPDPRTLDNNALTEHIQGYLIGMRQSGVKSASPRQAFYAIKHYYTTKPNKRSLEWDEIKSVLGEKTNTGHKKGYTQEEIKKLL